jgi:flagellar biosynthetic protein FlhB
MADEQDQSQKTEEPSQKKLDDAHERGEVAKSRDVNHWFMLLAITLAVLVSAKSSAELLAQEFAGILGNAHGLSATSGIEPFLLSLMATVGVALGLPMALLMGGALLGALVQHKPVFSAEKLKPNLEKISLSKGMKRLFSAPSWVELLKTVLKFLIVGGVVAAILLPKSSLLVEMPSRGVETILPTIYVLTLKLLGGVLAVMAVLAGADYLFQVQQHRKRLRMTKQELKDEFKQTDGDPMVKARLRQIRAERSRKRMMAAVPEADVVVTNPTHYAVAMKYDHGKMEAPKVVAKGVDHLAARIRAVAEEHKVPIVENPPLARALYATVEVDQEIPPEHYRAVAEVISFIMKLRRNAQGRR